MLQVLIGIRKLELEHKYIYVMYRCFKTEEIFIVFDVARQTSSTVSYTTCQDAVHVSVSNYFMSSDSMRAILSLYLLAEDIF